MLVRDPQLAHDGLLVRIFRDEAGRWDPALGRLVGGRSGEGAACAFYLEHRVGPRMRSLSDLEPVIGRSLSAIDVEQTVQEIHLAIEAALPRIWRAPTVLSAGWGIGVARLRAGVMQRRAGLPEELPPELEQRSIPEAARALRRRVTMLREELIARQLVAPASAEVMELEGRAPLQGFAPDAANTPPDRPLVGWKAIADYLGCSERTARRWHDRIGLPISQPGPACLVSAMPGSLSEWRSAHADLVGVTADDRK